MQTIAMINNKGGVGKTSSVTTIGHMMAVLHNKRVLIVDMDPQANASAMFSDDSWMALFIEQLKGLDIPDLIRMLPQMDGVQKELSVEDLLLNRKLDPHKVIRHSAYDGLDILPARLTLSTVEERLKADVTTPQQFKLKTQLEKVREDYDYCLIDCSPSVSLLNINALAAADEVYIPLRCDGNSLIGLTISLGLVETVKEYSPGLRFAGCFLTQYSPRKNVARATRELLEQVFCDGFLLPITIGTSKLLEENTYAQQPLLALDSGKQKSAVTKAYMDLTEYILAPSKSKFLKEYRNGLDTHM